MQYFVLHARNTQWQQEIRQAKRKNTERSRIIMVRARIYLREYLSKKVDH